LDFGLEPNARALIFVLSLDGLNKTGALAFVFNPKSKI
jgi:hypothetical protein